MSALDLDEMERLALDRQALDEAQIIALITSLRATESERDDLRCEVEALQAERDTARLEAGRLRARLRAAEARIERVGAILSDEGCDCYCDCDSDGHNADCDLCLACRIDREVSP